MHSKILISTQPGTSTRGGCARAQRSPRWHTPRRIQCGHGCGVAGAHAGWTQRIRPFWPRSGAIGVSTTIGAPQATQGLVRRASFICFLLPLLSDVLIDRCGLLRLGTALQPGVLGRQRMPASRSSLTASLIEREQ